MHIRSLSAVLLALITAGPMAVGLSADAEPTAASIANAPIKRFMQVGTNLYRGAQPDRDGFTFLRDLGIRTVVSFRNDDSERTLVEALGMTFVHIPVTFRPLGGEMREDAAVRFLATVDNPASGPVFVHCKRGADRTGAFVGLYRMLRQGWDVKRAYSEARDIGMRWWYVAVKDELAALARTFGPTRVVLAQ
jgi:tyrosine-protein phosphatase SIW14